MSVLTSDEFIIREVDIARDAEKLAVMWRASDNQWPGTWSGGTEITPQMVTEWSEREGMLNVFVVETADREKIVGYCSFNELMEEKNAGYVALLNVQPEYQKKSLARRLLQKSVERCLELGFHKVTLGTWSGNLKSVPLYKKTGFYWMPDTSVWMLNFVPGILSLPCTQPYFSKHNWYKTMQRELIQDEDDVRWEGMKVFAYHFEEDGESVKVWADRESSRITAIETDAFFAGAIAGNIEPPKGMLTSIRWRLMNKQNQPMSVSLIASGTEYMKLDYRTSLQLKPGEEVELSSDVEITLDAPDVQSRKPVPAMRTLLIIDGEVLELGTGMRPQPAVSVSVSPEHVTLMPNVEKRVHIQLHSYLQQDCEVTVRLTAPHGLHSDWTEATLVMPAKGWGGVPVKLRADTEGVYLLQASVSFEGGKTAPQSLPVFCMPIGGVQAFQGEKITRIENSEVRLSINKRGGTVGIHTVKNDTWLGTVSESVGPPFWPTEFREKDFSISLLEKQGRITATITANSDVYPGLSLCRQVMMGAGGLVEVNTKLINYGAASYDLQVSRTCYMGQGDYTTITVPLAQGIVQARKSEFPDAEEDISKKPDALAERWVALSSSKGTLGVLWEAGVEENGMGWAISLLTPCLHCAPQTHAEAGRFFIYAGSGDWNTVRDYARTLSGADNTREDLPARVRKVHGAYFEPVPLVTVLDTLTPTLVIDNLRGKPMSGSVQIEVPADVVVDRSAFSFEDLSRDKSLREPVALELPAKATVYNAVLNMRTKMFDARIPAPIIRLGSEKPVKINIEETVVSLDNGLSRFEVAPAFSGALTAWHMGGHNHLLSPYPEVKTFGWMSPWYGGITPLAFTGSSGHEDDFPGKLHQETLTVQSTASTDTYGIPWCGARLTGSLQRDKFLGLDIVLDYLTVGDSNVLKLVYQVTNSTTAERYLEIGWAAYFQPDGDAKHNVLRGAGMHRKPNPWYSWAVTGHSAWLTNANTGRSVAIISPFPDVRLMDWGDAGGQLGCYAGVRVPPSGTLQRSVFLVLCDDLASAESYAALKDYRET